MKVTKTGEDTTLAQMIHMVEEAQDNKAKTQKFMESFSTYYTPFIVLLSIFIYLISFDIRTAVTMLVIACPGALVIATPVSFVAGIGNAAKQGILFKGGDSIERLSKGNIVFFDKTGTLTEGKPELMIIESYDLNEDEMIRIAAIGESYSEHPLASAIINKAKLKNLNIDEKPDQTELMIGKGISFRYNEVKYYIGNYKMLPFKLDHKTEKHIKELEQDGFTTLIMSDDNKVLGLFGIADTLRPKTKSMIAELKKLSIKDTIMLTGDQAYVAGRIANEIGINTYHYGLLPEDKANIIKSYQTNNHTIFVGDGINDALALSYADASVAIGGLGKDLAMETAEVVLRSEDIGKLTDAIKISRKGKTNRIQNSIFALLVVAFLMVGVIFNEVSMSMGMLVHELSVLLVIINAIRLLRYKPHKGSI
jgi:Cd2+/Zn2+-exporting ATPase